MLGCPSRGAGVSKTQGRSSNVRALRAAMVLTARSVPSRTSSLLCGLRPGRPYLSGPHADLSVTGPNGPRETDLAALNVPHG
eukprot:13847936-Heterocapsa_arctica.AAC.1